MTDLSPLPPAAELQAEAPQRGRGAGYALEEQVGFLLRRAHQRSSEVFADVFEEFGVTPTQFAALAKLDDAGPTSQNQLGRLTAMDPATVFGVVGRLIKRGYVVQEQDQADARAVRLSLTPDGAAAARRMKAVAAEVSRRTLEPLDPAEAALFVALLRRLG